MEHKLVKCIVINQS